VLQVAFGQRMLIYEGSSKKIYSGFDEDTLVVHFIGDGSTEVVRAKTSEALWLYLRGIGIDNGFVRGLNVREQLVKAVDIHPVFMTIHNISQIDLRTRLGIQEGTLFPNSLVEWRFRSKALDDPIVSREHITCFGWLQGNELDRMQAIGVRANDVLRALFCCLGLRIASIELEFGICNNQLILTGELSPRTIKYWDDDRHTTMLENTVYQVLQDIPIKNIRSTYG